MAAQGKRTLEDIAATQAEHTHDLLLIGDLLREHTTLLKAIETAIQLLSGNILALRTEMLVIKGMLNEKKEED